MLRTYWATRGKRSIDYPAQGKPYNVSPPLERRDLWGVSVDGSRYTVVRTHPNFDPNPGDLFIIRKTHAQAFHFKRNVRSGIRTRVLNDAKCDGANYWATGVKIFFPGSSLGSLVQLSQPVKTTIVPHTHTDTDRQTDRQTDRLITQWHMYAPRYEKAFLSERHITVSLQKRPRLLRSVGLASLKTTKVTHTQTNRLSNGTLYAPKTVYVSVSPSCLNLCSCNIIVACRLPTSFPVLPNAFRVLHPSNPPYQVFLFRKKFASTSTTLYYIPEPKLPFMLRFNSRPRNPRFLVFNLPRIWRLFCLQAKNGLGRFDLSALSHYEHIICTLIWRTEYQREVIWEVGH